MHCWSCKGVEKKKSGERTVVLQLFFATGAPTVWIVDVPPEPNPVASDIVSRNCVPSLYGNCGIEYEPWPLLNDDAGTEKFCSA